MVHDLDSEDSRRSRRSSPPRGDYRRLIKYVWLLVALQLFQQRHPLSSRVSLRDATDNLICRDLCTRCLYAMPFVYKLSYLVLSSRQCFFANRIIVIYDESIKFLCGEMIESRTPNTLIMISRLKTFVYSFFFGDICDNPKRASRKRDA